MLRQSKAILIPDISLVIAAQILQRIQCLYSEISYFFFLENVMRNIRAINLGETFGDMDHNNSITDTRLTRLFREVGYDILSNNDKNQAIFHQFCFRISKSWDKRKLPKRVSKK